MKKKIIRKKMPRDYEEGMLKAFQNKKTTKNDFIRNCFLI